MALSYVPLLSAECAGPCRASVYRCAPFSKRRILLREANPRGWWFTRASRPLEKWGVRWWQHPWVCNRVAHPSIQNKTKGNCYCHETFSLRYPSFDSFLWPSLPFFASWLLSMKILHRLAECYSIDRIVGLESKFRSPSPGVAVIFEVFSLCNFILVSYARYNSTIEIFSLIFFSRFPGISLF